MKKRNHSRRQRSRSDRRSRLNLLEQHLQRRRRTWTFEQLEERHFLSASPLTGLEGMQWATVSNSTPEGQQLISAIEQMWAAQATTPTNLTGAVDLVGAAIPTDPYFQYQWHLFNAGQVVNPGQFQDLFGVPGEDINVIPAWASGVTGNGVLVAVVDTGLPVRSQGFETIHPDLAANVSLVFAYDALNNDNDPSPGTTTPDGAHGTAVAGLIGAVAGNGIGGVGVAFGSTIVPIKLLPTSFVDSLPTSQAIVRAIGAQGAPIDVFNHSWAPSFEAFGRSVAGPDVAQLIALTNSARLGRNGLGSIHVFAAGNFAQSYHSAGSNGYVNSRYTIGVGIVDHDGTFLNTDGTSTLYGEMAPSVLVVAPSASGPTDIIHNFETGSGIFTTDLATGGYNLPPLLSGVDLDVDTFPDPAYTTRFGGTSAAAPLVSGVIALMLEANPNLTNRDVQEILVRSSRQNDDLDISWITNLVPLFRDPIRHNGSPPNYTGGEGSYYPSDENLWNDEIVYQLIPGMVMEAAEQATTGLVNATNSDFTVEARADRRFDGWVANNLTVAFRAVPDPEGIGGAFAQIVSDKILVTVLGDSTTWADIEFAIEQIGVINNDDDTRWFDVDVTDPAEVFFPEDDRFILARLSGGRDATGFESTLVRAPTYENYHPIADPILTPEPLSLFTNGAGYTVSHGRHGNAMEYGYAHGVVDAALAVELARQWHLKDQNLASEKTIVMGLTGSIRIRAAEITNEESGEFVIPGGLSNSPDGFAEYFNEFFEEPTVEDGDPEADPPTVDTIDPESLPFTGDDPPVNTRGGFIPFSLPAVDPVTGGSNLMSMEWVEVQLNVTGDADAMNYLRITLVSPDGTHSELTQNHYMPEHINNNFQSLPVNLLVGFGDSIAPEGDMGGEGNVLDWVYSTNRIWGERSDSRQIVDEFGRIVGTQGWELHFENYSETDLQLNGVTVAFHGTPIGSSAGPVERVMGKVGVDSGRFIQGTNQVVGANDGQFNFNRYVTGSQNTGTPFGNHEFRVADSTQEQFASNITVYAIDNSTGQRVAHFVTGADGNYYFDLPAGEYTISIEDPLGRTALSTGPNYDSEWVITIDTDDFLTRTAGEMRMVPLIGEFVVDKMYDSLNFLLDPGSVPSNEVIFTGQVSGDLNGNGLKDPSDAGVSNFLVFADLNGSGQFEVGEPSTLTDVEGNYELHVATGTPNTFSIGVRPPGGWTATFPNGGFHHVYAQPGNTIENFNFLYRPPAAATNVGNGGVFGFVYSDRNGDSMQQPHEIGVPNVVVYVDANENGELDPGEVSVETDASGAYFIGDLSPGTYQIRVIVEEPYQQTAPGTVFRLVTLAAGQVAVSQNFGLQNLAIYDFGDLVGPGFRSTLAEDGPRHLVVPGFSLGSRVDAERNSNIIVDMNTGVIDPARHGIGDDIVGPKDDDENVINDEDGVVLVGGVLRPGVNTLSVTVNGVGGYLQGWIDFDNSGSFEPNEQIFVNLDINPGTHQLLVIAPQDLPAGPVAARFRWGTVNQTYFGEDIIGEVEDYLFDTDLAQLVLPPGDFNGDLIVNMADAYLWKATFGSMTDLRADANGDGIVDAADYTIWRQNMLTGAAYGDFNGDFAVNMADYGIWKATLGSTTDLRADANGDGIIDTADYTIWRNFAGVNGGGGSGGGAAAAATNPSGAASASHSALDSLARELSLAAWQQRQAQSASLASQLGGQAFVFNGINGPETRYVYTAPAAESSSTIRHAADFTEGPAPSTGKSGSLGRLGFQLAAAYRPPGPTLRTVTAAGMNGEASHLRLEVLDRAIAAMSRDAVDEPAVDGFNLPPADDEDAFELALAAVFGVETDWRASI